METPEPLNPFEAMIKSLPVEIQLTVEKLLRGFGITNRNDPLVQIVTALGLYAAYYEKIPARVTQAGEQIESQNQTALKSLDARVRILRGFAVVIQTATDRLATVPQEIVDNFPTQKVAEALRARIDDALHTLPLSQFEASAQRLNGHMGAFIVEAKRNENRIAEALSRLKANAADIANMEIPAVSAWRGGGFFFVGFALAALIWWSAIKPLEQNQADAKNEAGADMKKVVEILYSESFITRKAVGGLLDSQPVILVRRENLKDYSLNPSGDLIVHLNK
jgi:hypothetical protein